MQPPRFLTQQTPLINVQGAHVTLVSWDERAFPSKTILTRHPWLPALEPEPATCAFRVKQQSV